MTSPPSLFYNDLQAIVQAHHPHPLGTETHRANQQHPVNKAGLHGTAGFSRRCWLAPSIYGGADSPGGKPTGLANNAPSTGLAQAA